MKLPLVALALCGALAVPASAGSPAQTSSRVACYFEDVKLSGAFLYECRTLLAAGVRRTITGFDDCNSPQAFQATGPRYRENGRRYRLYDSQQAPHKSRFSLSDEGGGKKMRVVGTTQYTSITVRNKSSFAVKLRLQVKCPS